MPNKNLNYYGYDKSTYMDCLDLIKSTDLRHMQILNLWFIVTALIFTYFSIRNNFGLTSYDAGTFVVYVVAGSLFQIILWIFRKKINKFTIPLMYINIIVVMSFGVACSISQPYMVAAMFLVFLMMIALSYIDTFYRAGWVLIALCAIFVTFSYVYKPESIMRQDMFDVIIVLILALVLHFTFQRARIQQFITYRASIQMQQDLEVRSSFDGLTSLLNRSRFFSVASTVIRQPHEDYMVMALLDLDKFKQINDTLGHQMGDKVIQTAGKTLIDTIGIEYGEKWSFPERAVSENLSFAGRLGGDEFVVLMRNLHSKDEVIITFNNILSSLNSAHMEGLNGIYSSIGVTEIKPSDRDVDVAYSRADAALYKSKEAGRNRVTFVNEDIA